MNRRAFCLMGFILLLVSGCSDRVPASSLRTITMPIGGKTYTLEVAEDETSRQQGLMERDSMPKTGGMIFIFEDVAERNFHMKNTRIPLDILFIDPAGRIIHWTTMRPYDLSLTPSQGPAKYAIELNAGQVNENGVKIGDVLVIPNRTQYSNQKRE